jgi:mxaJ protein
MSSVSKRALGKGAAWMLGLAGAVCLAAPGAVAAAPGTGAAAAPGRATAPLRVCADPDNLPFSNRQQQGFENRIAALMARDLGTTVSYTWFPQRDNFFEKTLDRGLCDVVMSVPENMPDVATTHSYYRSTYVFVTRSDRHLDIASFDDPRLRTLKIGVHVLGDQDDSLPPVHAFTSRGIVHNLVGFSIFGNLDEKNPPSDLIRAVTNGAVDVAVAWGPMAGYFARQSKVPLELTPVERDPMHPALPFAFNIGIGVRENDTALKQALDAELERRQAEIERILHSFGIPETSPGAQEAKATED